MLSSIMRNSLGKTQTRFVFSHFLKKTGHCCSVSANFNRPELIARIDDCLKLNEAYQQSFQRTKKKLQEKPDEPQFEFSENYIFGRHVMCYFSFLINQTPYLDNITPAP